MGERFEVKEVPYSLRGGDMLKLPPAKDFRTISHQN